jgi:hypothetical protein
MEGKLRPMSPSYPRAMNAERPVAPAAFAGRNYGGFPRQVDAMRIAAGAALIAFLLAGCADSQFGGSLFYLRPYNIENLSCDDLKARRDGQTRAVNQKSDLREKAAANPVGSAIGAVVYGPDQNAALWTGRQYQEEYARRNCAASPPPAVPPPAPPPAAPPK